LKHLIVLLAKWKTVLMAFVKPLGIWGMGLVATVDAAAIPLPMDLIMAGYAWEDRQHFYLYAILAGVGSAVGALVPYFIGRAGGELFLLRRVNRAKFDKVRAQFEKQEFAAILIPSAMPPPWPWKVFLLGAGVFEMKIPQFMLAIFLGRTTRYLIEGLLTVLYGPEIIVVFGQLVREHLILLLVVIGLLMGGAVWWAIRWQMRHKDEAAA
jgi:membrane protein YqaA with SNARE-associated domain